MDKCYIIHKTRTNIVAGSTEVNEVFDYTYGIVQQFCQYVKLFWNNKQQQPSVLATDMIFIQLCATLGLWHRPSNELVDDSGQGRC